MNEESQERNVFFPEEKAVPDDAEREEERVRYLRKRLDEKIDDYARYQFTVLESRALNSFFDLAQEFDDVYDLFALCVTVPKVFFDKEAVLYLLDTDGELEWRCCSALGCPSDRSRASRPKPPFVFTPTVRGGHYYIPIKGNHDLVAQLPFEPREDVIGLLDVSPADHLSDHERLFFEKYANRIGFQLHNRIISQKNREHLAFIHNLVDDIGHNVIVPNMYFRLFYRRLESKIRLLNEISREFAAFTSGCSIQGEGGADACKRLQREMDYTYESLMDQFHEIYRHYEQTSLFLETLLRRGHFEKGHYVLEKKRCNVKDQIVGPQVARYGGRLEERGVEMVHPPESAENESLATVVDVGLISQVFANLLSNAVKYTRAVHDSEGRSRKFVSYFWHRQPDFFGPGRDGVRIGVFSTGPHLSEEDRDKLYSEGFRGTNAKGEYGTGHGLHFVREVVILHGGEVGYEATPMGNNFYFVLPLADSREHSQD